ncbi:MAG: type III-A CRISPR-associated protein Csm2 [Bacteroidales bacterium]
MENLDVIKPEQIIQIADNNGKLFKSIKTNQIRNFFASILAIKNKVEMMEQFDFSQIEADIHLLKPKIAYAAGRKKEVMPFKEFVDELVEALIKSSNREKAMKTFFSLIESVVAYHKFHGGKDN